MSYHRVRLPRHVANAGTDASHGRGRLIYVAVIVLVRSNNIFQIPRRCAYPFVYANSS